MVDSDLELLASGRAAEAGGLRWRRAPAECDLAVVGGGILGLAVARELHAPAPRAATSSVLERGAEVGTRPDRPQQRRDPRRHLLRARLAQGAAVRGGRARDVRATASEHGDRARALRQADRGARRDASSGASTSSSGAGARTACRGCAGCAASEIARDRAALPRASPRCTRPSTGHRRLRRGGALARRGASSARACRWPRRCAIEAVDQRGGRIVLAPRAAARPRARFAVFCAGAGSDRLAVAAGAPPDPRIVPFRGAYLYLQAGQAPRWCAADLPGARPVAAVPRRAPHPAHRRRACRSARRALLWPRGAGDAGLARHAGGWRAAGGARASREIRHAAQQARASPRAAADYVPELGPGDFDGGFAGRARPGARPRRHARRRLRGLGDRARAARAQRAVAGGHLVARARRG